MISVRQALATAALAGALGSIAGCAASSPVPSATAVDYTALNPLEITIHDPDWMIEAFGSLWVKRANGTVNRLDPATGEVTAEIPSAVTEEGLCEGLGAGSDAVWTCSVNDLVRIDPASNTVAATVPAGKIRAQGRLVSVGGHIWVLAGDGDRLVGVAEADGAITPPITLPLVCTDLAAGGDAVYAVCPAGDRVLRIDPAAGTVTAEATLDEPMHAAVNAAGVWVSSKEGMTRLDLTSLSAGANIPGVVAGPFGGVWADEGAIYVRRVSAFLTRIDATTSAVTHVVSAPFDGGGDVVGVNGALWTCDSEYAVVVRLRDPSAN